MIDASLCQSSDAVKRLRKQSPSRVRQPKTVTRH